MPFFDHPTKDPCLSLTHSNLSFEVVTIHESKGIQHVANGKVIKWLIGQLALRKQLPHHLLPLVDGVLSEADVGRIYELLG